MKADQRISDILLRVAQGTPRRKVTVNELLRAFGDRGFGAFIFLFAVPNLMPVTIPGQTAVLGFPLILLAWQWLMGRSRPWFPQRIARHSFRRHEMRAAIAKPMEWLKRGERYIKPRQGWVFGFWGEKALALLALALAVVIFLPIPLGNMLPALALMLIGLGLVERDGVAALVGAALGVSGLMVVSGVLYAMVLAGWLLFEKVLTSLII